MKKLSLAVLAAASVLTTGVQAASKFDGFYAGVLMNAYITKFSNYTNNGNINTYSSDTNYAPSLFAGYGATLTNKIYLGAEINWSNEGAKYTGTRTFLNGSGPVDTFSGKFTTTKTIAIKGGYLLSDNFMMSLKYKRGNADTETSVLTCGGGGCFGGTGNVDIQSIGIGMDYKLTNNVFATAEVAKTTLTQSTVTDVVSYNLGAGLGYRF